MHSSSISHSQRRGGGASTPRKDEKRETEVAPQPRQKLHRAGGPRNPMQHRGPRRKRIFWIPSQAIASLYNYVSLLKNNFLNIFYWYFVNFITWNRFLNVLFAFASNFSLKNVAPALICNCVREKCCLFNKCVHVYSINFKVRKNCIKKKVFYSL